MNVFMFLVGYILGFIRGWKLALVICATLPLLGFLGAMMGKIIEETTKDNQTWCVRRPKCWRGGVVPRNCCARLSVQWHC